jgi:glycerol-3-phosphate acyltransferase PlsY
MIPEWVIYLLVVIGGYLVGSTPTGYILGKLLHGRDIRNYGSGNTGFSNVYRLLGKGPAIITIVGDVFVKGFAVAISARLVMAYCIIADNPASFYDVYRMGYVEIVPQIIVVLTGLMAIAGHNWPIWLKFKGGKGMATTAGIFICFVPLTSMFLGITWFVVVKITKYTSLGNIVVTAALPIISFFEAYFAMGLKAVWYPIIGAGVMALAMVLWTHRENIQRLLKGEERKFGDKSERLPETKEK